jgi:hypothetical protein
MNIWTFVCRYDGELAVSTHLTQKGALLVAIGDTLDYLGIYEEYFDDDRDEKEYPPWRKEQLDEMDSERLTQVYRLWSERTWDHFNYESEVIKTKVEG